MTPAARPAPGTDGFTRFRGVIPAHVTPFTADLDVDDEQLRRHVADLIGVEGVTGITTTAHASEVAALDDRERARMLEVVLDATDGRVPVIAGIFEDGSAKAAAAARRAEQAGASGLLVFPSAVFDFGSQHRVEVPLSHYSAIAEATALPIIVFAYPQSSPLHLTTEALVRICTDVDNVVSVKEWTNDIVVYERNFRRLKELDKQITVLSSFSRALLASLVVGSDGILSGHGSVVADQHVRLWRSVNDNDLAAARAIWAGYRPFADLCYSDPFLDSHNRMKEALVMLGRLHQAHVRPPLQDLTDADRSAIRLALEASSLLDLTHA